MLRQYIQHLILEMEAEEVQEYILIADDYLKGHGWNATKISKYMIVIHDPRTGKWTGRISHSPKKSAELFYSQSDGRLGKKQFETALQAAEEFIQMIEGGEIYSMKFDDFGNIIEDDVEPILPL